MVIFVAVVSRLSRPPRPLGGGRVDALIQSFLLVFFGEMGDKTQLLTLILLARYKKPWPILSAIFIATILNHALATWIGTWMAQEIAPNTLRIGLAIVFFGFAAWVLVPDETEEPKSRGGRSAFWTTLTAFFIAEMGDKTQLATVALGARYAAPISVTIGTTIGITASNALVIFLGARWLSRIPMQWIRRFAALLFVLFGAWLLLRRDH